MFSEQPPWTLLVETVDLKSLKSGSLILLFFWLHDLKIGGGSENWQS